MTSLGGLSANDTIVWSQLGADATDLAASPGFTSTRRPDRLGHAWRVRIASSPSYAPRPCAVGTWPALSGFSAGDSLIWTADTGNSGNGPLTLNFTSKNVSGAGACASNPTDPLSSRRISRRSMALLLSDRFP